jgi:hypothetical protein
MKRDISACAARAKTTPALLSSGTPTKHTADRYQQFMRLLITTLLAFMIFCSCGERKRNINYKSDFELKSDLLIFTTKMTQNDTIKIFVNASGCLSECYLEHIITKKNDSIFIQTEIEFVRIDKGVKSLPKTLVENIPGDSLNFESFFTYLNKKKESSYSTGSLILSVIVKNDKINFYSSDFVDRLQSLSYYEMIMRRIYPNEEFFKPPVPPPQNQIIQ